MSNALVDLKGNPISIDTLPAPSDKLHWTPNRKYIIVQAVQHNVIPLSYALDRYRLSEEEFRSWESGLAKSGKHGLMITKSNRAIHLHSRHT